MRERRYMDRGRSVKRESAGWVVLLWLPLRLGLVQLRFAATCGAFPYICRRSTMVFRCVRVITLWSFRSATVVSCLGNLWTLSRDRHYYARLDCCSEGGFGRWLGHIGAA
jgi:hypothetical protein